MMPKLIGIAGGSGAGRGASPASSRLAAGAALTPVRLVVVSLLTAGFVPALIHLIDTGRTNEYAGHAMFVPLFSLMLSWMDRDCLRRAAGRGEDRGVLVMAIGAGLVGVGYRTGSSVVESLAVATTVAGVIIWLYGTACLRAAAFPVGFLVLMTPPPHFAVAMVTQQLQVFAATFAAGILRIAGIQVYQAGTLIELPKMILEVAEACNGLRFLLALLVLTAAFAQITQRALGQKALLIAMAPPIAVLANVLRVAVIGLGVQYWGPEAASGAIHHWMGKAVWVMTIIPLVGFGIWLAREPSDLLRAARQVPRERAGIQVGPDR